MLRTLEDITSRIAHQYNPLSVVLFGSRATGTYDTVSDIDLLVTKETDKRPIERRVELESILSDRRVALDIFVYTPDEILELFRNGSSFIDEIVTTGKVLYMRKNTGLWMKDAEEEIESAGVLLKHCLYRASCFHSQQAAEKSLKAALIESGSIVKRTHDILDLRNEVNESLRSYITVDDAVYINSIYKGRYPSEQGLLPHGEPTADEANRAIEAARRIFSGIKSSLR